MSLLALALSFWTPAKPWPFFTDTVVGYAVSAVNFAVIPHPSHDTFFPGQAMAHIPTIVIIVLWWGSQASSSRRSR